MATARRHSSAECERSAYFSSEIISSRAACAARLDQYDQAREFLRRCNVGGEFMQDADLQRVLEIGTGYRWRDMAGVEADFLSADEIENPR